MAIAPIAPIMPFATSPVAFSSGIDSISGPAQAGQTAQVGGNSFTSMLDTAFGLEKDASTAALKLATGDLADVQQFTAASAKASLAVELTAAVRNRAVDAFSEIMRMQV